MYTLHVRVADLPLFCVSATVQYWYRIICSIVRRNPAAYALALNSDVIGTSYHLNQCRLA